jgi:MSHA biogenesis protein MshN
MSVINQVLLDLENRGASSAERRTLHNHVRVMSQPQATGRSRAARVAAPVVAALALAAAWIALQGTRGTPQEAAPAISPAPASPKTAAPGAPEAMIVPAPELQVAARLSFELSRLPEPLPEPNAQAAGESAIPVARVLRELSQVTRAPPVRAQPAAASRIEAKPPVAATPGQSPESGAALTAQAAPAISRAAIDKRVRDPTPQQLAEAEYRRAMAALDQGRPGEARAGFEAALARDSGHHAARQVLLGVLVETGRRAEAEQVMHDGLQIAPHQIGFAMALARLQVDREDTPAAIVTLQNSLAHAQGNGDYLAFLAGLLQREQRHSGAIEQFQAALRLWPNNGVWLLGLGMSLQALKRDAEAREAFQQARTSPALSADLQAFADQRLQQLE